MFSCGASADHLPYERFGVKPPAPASSLLPQRYKIMDSFEAVQNVGATATKEHSMLQTMHKMEHEWDGLQFKVMAYKDSGKLCSHWD